MKCTQLLIAIFIPIAVGLLGVAGPVTGQTDPSKRTNDSVEQALTKLDRELFDALVRKDTAFEDRVEVSNHVFVNPAGGVAVKNVNPAPGPTLDSLDTSDVQVSIHGDTAVLTGRAELKGRTLKGIDINGSYRYMRVFVKQKGQWRSAAISTVRIQQPSPTK